MDNIKPITNYAFASLNKEVAYITACTDIATNSQYDLAHIDIGVLYRKAQNGIDPYASLTAFFTALNARLNPSLDTNYILFWTKKFNEQVDKIKNGVTNPGLNGKFSDCVGILSNDEYYYSRETADATVSSDIPKNILSPFIKLPTNQNTLYSSLMVSTNNLYKENMKTFSTTAKYTEQTLIFKAAIYAKLVTLYTAYISILNSYAKLNNIQVNDFNNNESIPYVQIKRILSNTVENLNLAQQNIQKDYSVYTNTKLLQV